MIFADTGGWFALVVVEDEHHTDALRWSRTNRELLLTSDYVIDETLTLMRARGHHQQAIDFGEYIFSGIVSVYFLTPDDIRATWETFRRYDDKAWSFTDCSSKVAMERLGITRAFAFDQHFRQFGNVTVVP